MYNKINYYGYNGKKIRKISMVEKDNILMFNSDYMLSIANPNECIDNASLLKENSKSFNIYKSGSISHTSLNL